MKSVAVALLGLAAISGSVDAKTHHKKDNHIPAPGQFVDANSVADEFLAKSMFDDFKTQFSRNYKNDQEETYRYGIFRSNLLQAAMLNERNGSPSFGVNAFSDLTQQEFAKTHKGYKPHKKHNKAINVMPQNKFSQNNATSVDWRNQGAVSAVKDQGQCGSCWAFSATEEVETAYFLAGKGLPTLAPQQVVDCDTVDQGCNGGDTPTAYQYIETNGLEPETAYPYTSGTSGVTGTCSYNSGDASVKISGFTYAIPPCTDACTSQNESGFASAVATSGPASICVNALAWQTYTSGVITATACGSSAYTSLDHCVQVVGYNFEDSTNPYWIVRNSWGTSWGNAGYIYVQYGTNACGIADEATFVTV